MGQGGQGLGQGHVVLTLSSDLYLLRLEQNISRLLLCFNIFISFVFVCLFVYYTPHISVFHNFIHYLSLSYSNVYLLNI